MRGVWCGGEAPFAVFVAKAEGSWRGTDDVVLDDATVLVAEGLDGDLGAVRGWLAVGWGRTYTSLALVARRPSEEVVSLGERSHRRGRSWS